MKTRMIGIFIFGMLLLITGCTIYRPMMLPTQTTIQIPPEKYEILQYTEVEGRATSVRILGIFWDPNQYNSGLIAAYKDALAKVPGANTLVNVKVDTQYANYLLFKEWTTIVSGFPAKIKP